MNVGTEMGGMGMGGRGEWWIFGFAIFYILVLDEIHIAGVGCRGMISRGRKARMGSIFLYDLPRHTQKASPIGSLHYRQRKILRSLFEPLSSHILIHGDRDRVFLHEINSES